MSVLADSGPTFAENERWSTDHSAELYKIDGWGAPYFSINASGNISVRPHGAHTLPHQEIDLMKVVNKAKSNTGLGLRLPMIVRFPDILKNRLESLQSSFDNVIGSTGYNSRYQGVYPVKCNQDRHVIQDIVESGSPFRFGLESGSKPELLLAMSCLVSTGHPDAFLVCNGYKDQQYITLALTARSLGLDTVIVLEQEEELDTVIDTSRKLGVRPVIGLRAKLRTKHSGHFGSTSGEKGKFGLTSIQIVSVVSKLRSYEMLDCLQLLHFHIGSQIPTTELLSDGVNEAAQIYCELVRMGAAFMRVINIGGGLGIDHDGSKSGGSDMSVEYGFDQYASAVVQTVKNACDRKQVKHPIICSESDRALVSRHSILVFETVSVSPNTYDPALISTDSLRLKDRCVEQFKNGEIGLKQLAAVDRICDFESREIGVADPVTTYHINLSIFTSVPDYWAIGQMFPVVPIHRLNEKPEVNGILSDLTCDSDGKMEKFIGGKDSLPLHDLETNKRGGGYYLAMFLGGAYQEALGGLHNLFGGPSAVRVVQSDGAQCFAVTAVVAGPSSADVLRAMGHEPEVMYEALKVRAEECKGEVSTAAAAAADVYCRIGAALDNMPYLITGGDAGLKWDPND